MRIGDTPSSNSVSTWFNKYVVLPEPGGPKTLRTAVIRTDFLAAALSLS